mgnify:FL=1
MYPSQIESGLLNGTPLALSNIVDLSAARQAEDLAAQQRADKIKADAQAAATLKKAAAQEAAIEAARAAAAEQARIAAAQRSTVNSGGDGRGAEQRAGGSKVGGVNRGTNAFSGM